MLRRFLLRLVLEEAMRREEKAYRFYESASKAVRQPESAELLRKLCAEELRHRLKLEELQGKGELEPAGQEEVEVEEAQAGLLAEPGPEWPPAPEVLEPRDIWAIALRKERRARDYYRVLSARAPVAAFREVFAYLSSEEQRHVDWVRAELEAAGGTGE
jgi:rubrerythrin